MHLSREGRGTLPLHGRQSGHPLRRTAVVAKLSCGSRSLPQTVRV